MEMLLIMGLAGLGVWLMSGLGNNANAGAVELLPGEAPVSIDPTAGTGAAPGGHGPTGWSAESWSAVIASKVTPESVAFALQWIRMESGGNPCSVGSLTVKGPDGNPQELGVSQLYNPDDLARFGADAKRLRAPCVGGTQQCSRAVTAEEMSYQADIAIQHMAYCKSRAMAYLASSGCVWNRHDQHCATKLWHGLPGILSSGLGATRTYLGRAPVSWAEFRATLNHVQLNPGTEHYRSEFGRILDNAERCASVVE